MRTNRGSPTTTRSRTSKRCRRYAHLRVLARTHWERAIKLLDYPAATPYSVSYYTLPKHWELARFVRNSAVGENALPFGDFEAAHPTDAKGVAVTSLPGWTVQEVALTM